MLHWGYKSNQYNSDCIIYWHELHYIVCVYSYGSLNAQHKEKRLKSCISGCQLDFMSRRTNSIRETQN
jgi:hypothetical protein